MGAGLEAVAERHDPPYAQAHQKQEKQAEIEGGPLPELGSVYICESQREGNHHPVEDVLIARVLVLEVHGPETEKNLNDDDANCRS